MSPQGQAALQQSVNYYRDGLFAEAEQSASSAIRTDERRPGVAEAYYVRGCARMRQGNRAQAVADFEQAVAKSRRAELTARAKASLGCVAVDNGDYAQAVDEFASAVDLLPQRPPLDEILLRYAIALQRTGDWARARMVLGKTITGFRGRPTEAEARRLFGWPNDYFSIQCGAFNRRSNAEKLKNELRQSGWPAEVHTDIVGGRGIYYVWLGQYATYAQAAEALPRIRVIEQEAFVVP